MFFCIYQPRYVLISVSCPSPAILCIKIGSYIVRGSEICGGQNMAWITSMDIFLERFILSGFSKVIVMMSLMNQSIGDF